MAHPIELDAKLSEKLGFKIYFDDVDVVREAGDDQSTIGHCMEVSHNVYAYRPFNEDRSDYLETIYITL